MGWCEDLGPALLRQSGAALTAQDLEPLLAALGTALPEGGAPGGLEFTTGQLTVKGVALGPMQETIERSLSQLSEADLQAMATYLKSAANPDAAESGKQVASSERSARSPGFWTGYIVDVEVASWAKPSAWPHSCTIIMPSHDATSVARLPNAGARGTGWWTTCQA